MIFYDQINFNNYEKRVYKVGSGDFKKYINFQPCGFDIETTTQYSKDDQGKVIEHYTNMYIWMFSFCGKVYYGRKWSDFSNLLKMIENEFCKGDKKFIIFIHNQNFEFAFMGRELEELGHKVDVFARKKRKPMTITIDNSIIFIDSYKLTGFSLKKLAENYTKTQKLVGGLDYTKLRNSMTPLSDNDEKKYCENDVIILYEYATYYESKYLVNGFMPLTNTMIANKVIKENIKKLKANKEVYFLMRKAYPKNRKQYEYIMSFYSGAYTHAMFINLFDKKENGFAFDVVSEYPYVMMSKYYPMSAFRKLHDLSKIDVFLKKYCCLVEVIFTKIKTKTGVTILSKHKLKDTVNCIWDNGRLYSADSVRARITEVDLITLSLHYEYEIEYVSCIYAERGYLPKWFRLSIAELYRDKQLLRGVPGKEIEYMESKKKLNGQYGSCCTRLEFTELFFDHGWSEREKEIDFEKIISGKNKLPQWAVYITAHARNLILTTVSKIKPIDYWYSDTDSIKCKNKKYILQIFEDHNRFTKIENKKWIDDLGLIGEYWDGVGFENMGCYDREEDLVYFKTLGSKRYLSTYNKNSELVTKETIAGLPKGTYVEWASKNGLDLYDAFDKDGVAISDYESNKLCTYYCDEERDFEVTDEYGNTEQYHTYSYVSLIPTSFKLGVDNDLIQLYNTLADNIIAQFD